MMKKLQSMLILLLLAVIANTAYSQQKDQKWVWDNAAKAGLSEKKAVVDLDQALDKLEQAFGVSFMYKSGLLDGKFVPPVKHVSGTLDEAVKSLLKPWNLTYSQINEKAYVIKSIPEEARVLREVAAPDTVKGTITDATDGGLLPGVNIWVKGTTHGTSTDNNGKYALDVESLQDTLVFSYIGYKRAEVPIKGNTNIDIGLTSQVYNSEELVVVGYGEQKKISLTASISNISGTELKQTPTSNISNALVGRLPGLTAIQSSGEPGYDQAQIKIRGIATLREGAESDPLIVVDGVERGFNSLDPNEIESINILKDAAATALYGVRGANGVIIVTTKTGKVGKPEISFSSNVGFQSPTRLPELVNSYEYAMLKNEALANEGKAPYFSEQDLQLYKNGTDPYFHSNVDWYNFVLKPYSLQQKHNISVSGGTDNTRYFIALGYFDQDGAYRYTNFNPDYNANAKYQRYNFRSNFDLDLTKNFTTSVKLGGQLGDENFPGQSAGQIFFDILKANPMTNPGIMDGKIIGSVEGAPGGANPFMDILTSGYHQNFDRNLNVNISMKYKLNSITQGLLVRGMVAYDSWYRHSVSRSKGTTTYRIEKDPADPTNPIFVKQGEDSPFSFSEGYGRWRKTYAEMALQYAHDFNKHAVSGLVLYNFEKRHNPNLAYGVPTGYLGAVARLNYNYNLRYFAEVNMGYNGSENFPKGKRFGFFPSFSAGWVISNEKFFPENDVLTFVKFRGSYGEVGNDRIGGERFMYLPSVFNYGGGYNLGVLGQNYQWYGGSREGKIGNPDVTWERAKKTNIGVETNFFGDRLSINGDYFVEKRDNILWYLGTVPALVQANLPPVNIGKVRNHGYEIEANFNSSIGRKFRYWVKGNYSFAKNEIQYMDEPNRAFSWLSQTGKPVGQFFGLTWDGFYNTEEELQNAPESAWATNLQVGDMKYKDLNGDGVIDSNDMGPIGYSTFPQVTYGFSFGGSYKGFDLSVLLQGASKVSRYFDQMAAWPFDTDWRAAMKTVLQRWTPERYANGDPISFPRLSSSPTGGQHNYVSSDFWLKDASYIRLKNVEVGYSFNGKLLRELGMSQFRVFANGVNLFTWSHMKNFDPEAPSGRGQYYPQMIVYNLGLNVKF